MDTYRKIEGNNNLVRDMTSKAIINTNKSDYKNYLNNKTNALMKNGIIEKQSLDISELKSDIKELKSVLKLLISGDTKCQR